MNAITVEQLRKSYGASVAVKEVSFEVRSGEIFGMIGPNGAGKTTTVECCMGLRKQTSGRVRILGMDPQTQRAEVFERVGAQLQETAYQEHIRVHEVCTAISCLYRAPRPWRELLNRFGLGEKIKSPVSSLSGGQRQRLSIALALIPGPEVVFLDELTTGLDPRARREMWEDVRTLRDEGVTVFMTTHYMEEAEYLCDRVAIIQRGSLLALDTVESLLDNSDLEHEISLLAPQADLASIRAIKGVRSAELKGDRIVVRCASQHLLAQIVLLLERAKIEYRNVRTRSPGLEEVFLALTDDPEDAITSERVS